MSQVKLSAHFRGNGRHLFGTISHHPLFMRKKISLDIGKRKSSSSGSRSRSRVGEARNGSSSTVPTSSDFTEYFNSRVAIFPELLRDISEAVRKSGLTGVTRTASVSLAVIQLLQEYASSAYGNKAGVSKEFDKPERILRKLFEKLGSTYIKLGQFIASSPTLFSEAYVMEFQKCLDSTTPVPFDFIKRRIEKELGKNIADIFSKIDEVPLASASIAQVHTAILKQSRKTVVIKVLKPGVEEVLTADLNFIYIASRLLEFVNPQLNRLSLSAIVSDIQRTISEEVDFKKEALHISHFANYLAMSKMDKYATCPFVYSNLSTKKVLVMEKLDGAALVNLEAIRKITKNDPESVLINALNTWFGSLISAETFHADVHAGNLLVLRDGRVGFIDFGIVGRISTSVWSAIEGFLVSVTTEDFDLMARSLATMGATSDNVNITDLREDLKSLFSELKNIDSQLIISVAGETRAKVAAEMISNDTDMNKVIFRLVRVGESHGIRFPREFGLLIKQLLYFDRYTKILAPTLQVMSDSRISIGRDFRY